MVRIQEISHLGGSRDRLPQYVLFGSFPQWQITVLHMAMSFLSQTDLMPKIQQSELEDELLLSELQINLFAFQRYNLTSSKHSKLGSRKFPCLHVVLQIISLPSWNPDLLERGPMLEDKTALTCGEQLKLGRQGLLGKLEGEVDLWTQP